MKRAWKLLKVMQWKNTDKTNENIKHSDSKSKSENDEESVQSNAREEQRENNWTDKTL